LKKSDHYKTVLLFGAPGTGKGTQGKILGCVPGFYHLSCGEVFRRLNPHSEIGQIFMEYSSRGELVPDDVTIRMWHEYIHAQETLNFFDPTRELLILDGIPRNTHQARLMDEHIEVLHVIHLTCRDQRAMIDRLRKRALKENRVDDAKEEVIRRRWEVYERESRPVLEHYKKGVITDVDAVGTPAEVLQAILATIVPIQSKHYKNALNG